MSNSAVLPIEILVTHDQEEYRIDETKNRRDESPAEKQVQDAQADTSQVELMYMGLPTILVSQSTVNALVRDR